MSIWSLRSFCPKCAKKQLSQAVATGFLGGGRGETWVGARGCFRISLRRRCCVWVNGGVPKTPGVVLGAKLFLLFWGVMGKVLGFLHFLITLLMIT